MTSSYKEHEHQYSLSPTLCYQTPNHLKGHRHHWHHKNLINQAPIIQMENKMVTKHQDHKLQVKSITQSTKSTSIHKEGKTQYM